MKKDKLIIILFSLVLGLLFIRSGSSMDFLNQHIVFPNYLRELFYFSGKIIPSFMIHIGAGENIFNIAYYGLLNPIIMISYLFPFIKMVDYIIVSNIVLFVLSNLLFYKFVSKFKNPLFLTFLFMLSGPILFQFHRHFMFVNYMPFLILALINIDNKKYIKFIIDIFLIIMTSFYYSIPALLCVIIYYIYINFQGFEFKKFLKFISCIFISVLASSILLVPVIYSIFSTRSGVSEFNLSLLIPNINLDNILYGGYSVGLTSICFVSFIYLLFSKSKKNIFLFVVLSLICFIPISLFLLNGGLYVRGKCLIPFLPLFIYIIGLFIDDVDRIDFKKFFIFLIFVNVIILIRYHVIIYYVDLLFVIILLFLYSKFKKKNILYVPITLMSLVICIVYNNGEKYFSRDYYNSLNSNLYLFTNYRVGNLVNVNDSVNIYSGNMISSIYSSTINKYYSNLYHNVFKVNNGNINNMALTNTSNPLFNRYMGIKYFYSDYELGFPYNKISDNLYELNVLPLGYINSRCVNKDYFESLEYPYYLDILSNYVVGDCPDKPVSGIHEIKLDYNYELGNSYILDGKLYVDSDDVIKVHINDDMVGKILFISNLGQFEQDNDINMSINNQSNLLTRKGWLYPNNNYDFNYVLSGNDLVVKVSKGVYNISNIKTYIMDYKFIDDYDVFNIDVINSEEISGNISVSNSGYFILSIPYDKGFDIRVNGSKIDYSEVNDLIGFYLEEGEYNIDIRYKSPGLETGKYLSCLGLCLFIVFAYFERRVEDEK